MIDSDAIRDAIGAIANEAHRPERIRAALDARYRFHHQRRMLLLAAGAAGTAAVAGISGVEVYRLTQREDPGFPSIAGGPGGGWLEAEPRWHPTWLPAGFGLTSLSVVIDGDKAAVASRDWTRPQRADEQTTPFVSLTTGWSDAYAPDSVPTQTEHVDVHGTPAELKTFDTGDVWLAWQPLGEPKMTVSVSLSDTERGRAVATRVAKSLQRDRDTVSVGPRPGWLPAEFATLPWMFILNGIDGTWAQTIDVRTPSADMTVAVGPSVGQSFNKNDAQPVRVRGVGGWLGPDGTELLAPMPDGFNVLASVAGKGDLTLTPAPRLDLVRIVENFDFGPTPDMTWYGSR